MSSSGFQLTKLLDSTELCFIVLRFKIALNPLLLIHNVGGSFFLPGITKLIIDGYFYITLRYRVPSAPRKIDTGKWNNNHAALLTINT